MDPVNGMVDMLNYSREGATVRYKCNDGFRPSNARLSTCESTAMWTPDPMNHECTFIEGEAAQQSNCHELFQ